MSPDDIFKNLLEEAEKIETYNTRLVMTLTAALKETEAAGSEKKATQTGQAAGAVKETRFLADQRVEKGELQNILEYLAKDKLRAHVRSLQEHLKTGKQAPPGAGLAAPAAPPPAEEAGQGPSEIPGKVKELEEEVAKSTQKFNALQEKYAKLEKELEQKIKLENETRKKEVDQARSQGAQELKQAKQENDSLKRTLSNAELKNAEQVDSLKRKLSDAELKNAEQMKSLSRRSSVAKAGPPTPVTAELQSALDSSNMSALGEAIKTFIQMARDRYRKLQGGTDLTLSGDNFFQDLVVVGGDLEGMIMELGKRSDDIVDMQTRRIQMECEFAEVSQDPVVSEVDLADLRREFDFEAGKLLEQEYTDLGKSASGVAQVYLRIWDLLQRCEPIIFDAAMS
eukprot:Hpha_TRINITY_DN9595_c0_g1::TRINITY_DN9595_c0_g1_i1::g.114903::m.114903